MPIRPMNFSIQRIFFPVRLRGKKAAFVSDSLKQGWDYRFEGKDKVGSALVYRQRIIHMAFFKMSKEERVGQMSGYKRRRGYRQFVR